MAAKSKHYGDVLNWLEDIVNSCKTPDHIKVAERLLYRFEEKYWGINEWLEIGIRFNIISAKLREKQRLLLNSL